MTWYERRLDTHGGDDITVRPSHRNTTVTAVTRRGAYSTDKYVVSSRRHAFVSFSFNDKCVVFTCERCPLCVEVFQ